MAPETLFAWRGVASSAIAYTEVMRAIRRAGRPTRRAEQVLRSSALSLRPDVDAFVSYDARLSRAATAAGLAVTVPGAE